MIAALLLAAKIVVVNVDDIMDRPQPKAPISQWTEAPDRKTVMLPVAGAVLRGYSYTDYRGYGFSTGVAPAAAQEFDENAMVRLIRAPLLVFGGTRDEAIPPKQGPQLERAAASPDKRFVAIGGAKHDWLLENPQSQAAVAAFLAHVLNF